MHENIPLLTYLSTYVPFFRAHSFVVSFHYFNAIQHQDHANDERETNTYMINLNELPYTTSSS